MRKLSKAERAMILNALVEDCSFNPTTRIERVGITFLLKECEVSRQSVGSL